MPSTAAANKSSTRKVSSKEKTSAQKGKNRATKKQAPPPEPSSDESGPEEESDLDDEILSELQVSDDDDAARPQPTNKKKQTVRPPKDKKRPGPKPQSIAPHLMMLQAVRHLRMSEIVYGGKSFWTPCSFMMFMILDIMHDCVSENSSLHKFCPQYMVGLSRLYYGVLWFIQVLRARDAAGALEQSEFQFLRFFTNNFAIEELPVAGPLVCYFSNIVAFKPAGNRYDYVSPRLPGFNGFGAAASTFSTRNLLTPPVPFLLDFIYKFSRMTPAQITAMRNAGYYRPFNFTTGGTLWYRFWSCWCYMERRNQLCSYFPSRTRYVLESFN